MSQKYYCPYCNYEYGEEDFGEDKTEGDYRRQCRNCNREIRFIVEVIINYKLKKQCEWNNEKHQWKDIGNKCVKCSVCDLVELKKNVEGWKDG